MKCEFEILSQLQVELSKQILERCAVWLKTWEVILANKEENKIPIIMIVIFFLVVAFSKMIFREYQ